MDYTLRPGDMPPIIPWHEFIEHFAKNWAPDEHLTAIGPTGSGKSYLIRAVLDVRKFCVVLATKPRDKTLAGMQRQGWPRLYRWPMPRTGRERIIHKIKPEYGTPPKRFLLWPPSNSINAPTWQEPIFREALGAIFVDGGWTVDIDEPRVMEQLHLHQEMVQLLTQGRSNGISVAAGSQRPVWLPREFLTMQRYIFLFRTQDATDLKALSGLGGLDSLRIQRIVANLKRFQALCLDLRDNTLVVTKVA